MAASAPRQRRKQLLVDAAEAAVRHRHNPVAIPRFGCDRNNQRFEISFAASTRAERSEARRGIPGKAGIEDVDAVSARKAPGQSVGHDAALEGVRARLENGEDARLAAALAQRGDGFADRGGVMRKIVVDRDTAHRTLQFEPAAHAFETGERRDRRLRFHPGMARGGDGGERVEAVVRPGQRPAECSHRPTLPRDLEGTIAVRLARLPSTWDTELLERRPAALAQYPLQSRISPVDDDTP